MGFVTRSLLVLTALYGLVFVIGDYAFLGGNAPLWWAVAFVTGIILLQYLLAPLLIEWVYTIDFDTDAIPAAQRAFVEDLCRQRGLPVPKLGIIYSGTPNAFAFGRLQGDARVVMTEGLLKVLTEDEANAVLAHEVGHIAHFDFAVMALAAIAPLLLYQIYVWTRRFNNHGRVVSYFAYLAYWVGQFLVLLLNRTREYGADHFSAEVTRMPGALSSALVKIGYGMVAERSELQRVIKQGGVPKAYKTDAEESLQLGSSLSLMGIASAAGHDAMALVAATPEQAARVMRWDLVNPWSRFYELGSTHPLTARRLAALNRSAARLGQPIAYPLPNDPDATRIRWAGFPIELFFWGAPLVCGFALFTWGWVGKSLRSAGVQLPTHALAWIVLAMGVTWAARIAFRYRGTFTHQTVGDLLDDLSVSQMRPRAVELTGQIIGHGIPGAFWSPDLVLQDDTGMMFLLYRSSVPFGRFFFAFRTADRLIGERVTVQGWYRRGLKPYMELAQVTATVPRARQGRGMTTLFGDQGSSAPVEYEPITERSYSRWIQLAAAAACTAAGIIWLLS